MKLPNLLGYFDKKKFNGWIDAHYVHQVGVDLIKHVLNEFKNNRKVEYGIVEKFVSQLYQLCKNYDKDNSFVLLARIKNKIGYSYTHPFNVCIYSMAMGYKMQYGENQIVKLGVSALLHDVGEVKLPERMLNKAAKYTETEMMAMQRHPELGYDILKRDTQIPEEILLGVLHHHERVNGSGYPSGHLSKFIHPFGKIIAVAESYDAMCTNRINADSIPPSDALKTIYSLSGKDYEANVVKILIMIMGMYPTGSLVRLNGGQLGIVLSQNSSDLSKPKVLVVSDANNQHVKPYLVDLFEDSSRSIMYAESNNHVNVDIDKYVQDYLKQTVQ